MKKILAILVSLIFIGLLSVFIFTNSPNLNEKRKELMEQVPYIDISKLLILKDAPVPSYHNNYQISYVGNGRYYFLDQFKFNDTSIKGLGITAFILEDFTDEQSEKENDDESWEKIIFKNVDAYYSFNKVPTKEKDTHYITEQLSFFKDNINYLISWGYIYTEKKTNQLDFINFLNKNLVPIGE